MMVTFLTYPCQVSLPIWPDSVVVQNAHLVKLSATVVARDKLLWVEFIVLLLDKFAFGDLSITRRERE